MKGLGNDYKPEAPSEGSGFEPFKYTGAVKINKAEVTINEKGGTEFYPQGCQIAEIEAEVLAGEFKGRKLWKRFNIDEEPSEGKKSPAQKLADQLSAVGLTFSDDDGLNRAFLALKNMRIIVKAWPATFDKGSDSEKTMQLWNIKKVAPENWEAEAKETSPAF